MFVSELRRQGLERSMRGGWCVREEHVSGRKIPRSNRQVKGTRRVVLGGAKLHSAAEVARRCGFAHSSFGRATSYGDVGSGFNSLC